MTHNVSQVSSQIRSGAQTNHCAQIHKRVDKHVNITVYQPFDSADQAFSHFVVYQTYHAEIYQAQSSAGFDEEISRIGSA